MGFWYTVIVLACYGALKEFKPTEPYLFEFEHVTLNISADVLNSEVYPIWTYTYMVVLIPVFLLTDLLVYKPLIVFEILSYLAGWLILDFASSVFTQQLLEFFYGCATATEIAYFAYIYVKVDKEQFKRVTSITRAALLFGRFSSYFVAQLVILTSWGTYRTLNWISTGGLCIGLVFAIFLPNVTWRNAYDKRFPDDAEKEISYKKYVKKVVKGLYWDARYTYSDFFVIKWSFWWALTSCMYFQITNYTQTLWGDLQDDDQTLMYNGFTEALCPLLSAPVVLLMQKVDLRWSRWGEPILALLSLVDGALLLTQALSHNIFVMYAAYITYSIIFEAMLTIAQFNLADRLAHDSFGLIFGLNTFIALVLQSILTFVVNDQNGLDLAIRPQFFVYASVHGVISIIFVTAIIGGIVYRKTRRAETNHSESEQVEESVQRL